MKLKKPELPTNLEVIDDLSEIISTARERDLEIEGHLFKESYCDYEDMSYSTFCNCIFDGCKLSNCNFEKATFRDCIFKNCDFSNCEGRDSYFNKCEIISSKMTGSEFCNSIFQDVLFKNTSCTYANFDESSFRNIILNECDMAFAEITQCKLKGFYLKDNRFNGTSFYKTLLNGIDFSDCQLAGIRISSSFSEIKGAVVNELQALELSSLLGIKIK